MRNLVWPTDLPPVLFHQIFFRSLKKKKKTVVSGDTHLLGADFNRCLLLPELNDSSYETGNRLTSKTLPPQIFASPPRNQQSGFGLRVTLSVPCLLSFHLARHRWCVSVMTQYLPMHGP